MIKYNLRYRGPFEYDKFALTIFNFYNEVRGAEDSFLSNDVASLRGRINKLDSQMNDLNTLMTNLLRLKLKV